jgi:hypothetical protein
MDVNVCERRGIAIWTYVLGGGATYGGQEAAGAGGAAGGHVLCSWSTALGSPQPVPKSSGTKSLKLSGTRRHGRLNPSASQPPWLTDLDQRAQNGAVYSVSGAVVCWALAATPLPCQCRGGRVLSGSGQAGCALVRPSRARRRRDQRGCRWPPHKPAWCERWSAPFNSHARLHGAGGCLRVKGQTRGALQGGVESGRGTRLCWRACGALGSQRRREGSAESRAYGVVCWRALVSPRCAHTRASSRRKAGLEAAKRRGRHHAPPSV